MSFYTEAILWIIIAKIIRRNISIHSIVGEVRNDK